MCLVLCADGGLGVRVLTQAVQLGYAKGSAASSGKSVTGGGGGGMYIPTCAHMSAIFFGGVLYVARSVIYLEYKYPTQP
jgi:hypothetical protein